MSKPHSLLRLRGDLYNKPHLIEQGSFNNIVNYLNSRSTEDFKAEDDHEITGSGSSRHWYPDTKTGIMYIDGPLTYRTTGWEALCGGTSYEQMKEQMEFFAANGAKTVAWFLNSGGGEAMSMMDTARYLRKLADDNGIQIIAWVDGMAASACYGIGCVAHEIVMSGDSMTGSIGVLIQLTNISKKLEKEGIERTFVSAGSSKIPYAEDGSFREGFIERLQEQVDHLYEGFTSHVAEYRGLSVEAVKATEADVFMAEESIQLGLADKILTVEEFYEYLAESAQKNLEGSVVGGSGVLDRIFKNNKQEDAIEMAQPEEMQAQLSAAQEQLAAMATLSAQVTEMQASFTAQAEELKAAKEALAAVEKAKAEAIVDQRKAALSEVLPEDQLEAALDAYGDMPQAAFDFTVSTLKAAKEKVASGEMMSEVGGDGAEQEPELDAVDAIKQAQLERAKAMKR